MGMSVNGGQPDPTINPGLVPQTTQDIKTFFGNGELFLKALTGVGVKEVGQTQTQAAAKDDRKMDGATSFHGKNFAEPAAADFDSVASVMIDPDAIISLGQNVTNALAALGALGQMGPQPLSVSGDRQPQSLQGVDDIGKASSAKETYTVEELAEQKNVLDKIADVALKFRGGMFDEGAIALQAILAEVAHMKKGQAYLMSQLSQQLMAAMIDGAMTQAQIAVDKSKEEAFASFMNAGLTAIGVAINLAGTANALKAATSGKISGEQVQKADAIGQEVGDNAYLQAKTAAKKNLDEIAEKQGKEAHADAIQQLEKNWSEIADKQGGKAHADAMQQFQAENQKRGMELLNVRTSMAGAVSSIFSQVGTNVVDGFKSLEVGQLEAQKIVLDNAMQIISQMMSKWSDEERSMHEDVTRAYDSMKQLHEAMVTNINKLAT